MNCPARRGAWQQRDRSAFIFIKYDGYVVFVYRRLDIHTFAFLDSLWQKKGSQDSNVHPYILSLCFVIVRGYAAGG